MCLQAAEDKAKAEIHSVTTATTNQQTGIEFDANNTRENDAASYLGESANLAKEVEWQLQPA
jgi:hypothetical protein